MSHWIGTTSPSDAGMNDFKECLKFLRDGRSEDALLHARRALGDEAFLPTETLNLPGAETEQRYARAMGAHCRNLVFADSHF